MSDRANRINAVASKPVMTEQRIAAREMTNVLRRLMERVVATQAPADAMQDASAQLSEIADVLDAFPRGRVYDFSESSLAGDPGAFFDNSPVAGLANPLAPPLRMHVEGEQIIGEVRWGSANEGAPGCVHGGYV